MSTKEMVREDVKEVLDGYPIIRLEGSNIFRGLCKIMDKLNEGKQWFVGNPLGNKLFVLALHMPEETYTRMCLEGNMKVVDIVSDRALLKLGHRAMLDMHKVYVDSSIPADRVYAKLDNLRTVIILLDVEKL